MNFTPTHECVWKIEPLNGVPVSVSGSLFFYPLPLTLLHLRSFFLSLAQKFAGGTQYFTYSTPKPGGGGGTGNFSGGRGYGGRSGFSAWRWWCEW